jgi:RimJ/RimL family protein N-acetyltransferase
MLLTLVQQFARDKGCERLASFVAPEAVEFYERCGFTVDADRTIGSSGRQSVFMTKDLKSQWRERSVMEGIRIRPYEPDDSAGLYAAALESVADVFPWLPWCHPGYSLAEAEEWTRSRPRLFKDGEAYDFVIADASGRFLGACGLNQINRDHRFANLGYWVRSSDTGRGLASAAVGHLAAFAFSQTDVLRLEIICAVGNTRSQRAAEKSGATREGVLRDRLFLHGQSHDAVVYSIVRSKWKA